MRKIKIVYVNTKQFFGVSLFHKRRIEISYYVKKYPELHKHILDHELKHFEYWDRHGNWSFIYDIYLEFRAEITEVFNETIRFQKRDFSKTNYMTWKDYVTQYLYEFGYSFSKLSYPILNLIKFFRRFRN